MSAIPYGDARALVRPERRTLVMRVALAALLAGALAVAWIAARPGGKHPGLLPRGRSPVVAIDMSWSVSYDNYAQIENTLSDLAGSGPHASGSSSSPTSPTRRCRRARRPPS